MGSLRGPFLGQSLPDSTPTLFAPGVVSTGGEERDIAISPDGTEIYFSKLLGDRSAIVVVRQVRGAWQEPQILPFSGLYMDLEPALHPDGSRLYFASNRPLTAEGEPADFDIWYCDRTGDGWSAPINPGPPLNSDANEFYPSVANDGSVYFCATIEDAGPDENIYRSQLVDGNFARPERLGPGVNTDFDEFNAFVSPDESYLIFSSFGREDGLGGGDLYVSFRLPDGTWSESINLGEEINSGSLDFSPFVSADGKLLFFTSRRSALDLSLDEPLSYEKIVRLSNGPGNGSRDIYWVETDFLSEVRPKP
jgi:Tol biopolymer transport system component